MPGLYPEPDSCESIDFESALIRRAIPSPCPAVCGFYFPGEEPQLYGLYELFPVLIRLLRDTRRCIVGQNIAYDMCLALEWGPILGYPEIVQLIFDAYDADRIFDTMLCQRLIEIEQGDKRGKLGLDELCKRYGLYVEKHGTDENGREIRLGFGKFLGCRADELPPDYFKYAIGDPLVTLELFRRQLRGKLVKRADLAELGRNDLALKLTSAFGLMTDAERVQKLEAQARQRIIDLQGIMFEQGFMRWERRNPKPVKTMAAIKCAAAAAYELDVDAKGNYVGPSCWLEDLQNQGLITKAGAMSTARLVLEESGDPILISLADYNEWAAVWNKDLKLFRTAVDVPFHTRFGFAATLRTTSGGPNIQNFRKKEGIRECIVARYGALVASDYTGLENGTLAQVIVNVLGRRGMADKISGRGTPGNKPWDFHCDVGAKMMNLSYEEFCRRVEAKDPEAKRNRNAAKPLNFGLPGYMSKATTVQSYARIGYGVNLPVERWQELMDLWYETQHDQVAYLREYVDTLRADGGLYNVPIPGCGVMRRGATRTAAANTGFQGLGGRVALRGLYYTIRAQMLGLMPGKVCAFIHDEEISDCKACDVDEVAAGQEFWMARAAEELLPDVIMHVVSTAMRHWSKKAERLTDGLGRLIVDHSH
jgi:hypothetical protein